MIEGFDKIIKDFDRERVRNTRLWFWGLCDLGGFCLIGAIGSQGLFSDFLINLSAGFMSAAVISLIIERTFSQRQQENRRMKMLFEMVQKYHLLSEQALADNDYTIQAVKRCQRLLEQAKNKSDEAKLDRYHLIVEIAQDARKNNSISIARVEQAIGILGHLWDEYDIDLKPIIGDGLQGHLAAMKSIIETKQRQQTLIQPYIDDTEERIRQVSE